MNELIEYLPFLFPFIILELLLAVYSAWHVWNHRQYRFGTMPIWFIIVLFIQLIGPILYFTIGRGTEE